MGVVDGTGMECVCMRVFRAVEVSLLTPVMQHQESCRKTDSQKWVWS